MRVARIRDRRRIAGPRAICPPASPAWWRRAPRSSWSRRDFSSPKGRSAHRMAAFISPTIAPIRIHFLDASGKITVAHENTNNANGLALTRDGDLLEVQGVGKRVNKRSRSGTVTTLTESFDGKPFMAPNDLFADAKGGIYFSDPGPRPVVPGRKAFVYYLPAGAKEPIVIDDQLGAAQRAHPHGRRQDAAGQRFPERDVLRLRRRARTARSRTSGRSPSCAISPTARKAAPTAWPSIVTAGCTSPPSPAFRFSTPLANTSAPFRRRARPPTWRSPDRTGTTLYITAREGLYRVKTLAQGPDRIGK